MANDRAFTFSVLIPISRAELRFISTARIAFPVLVFRRNRKSAADTSTLPTEATAFGTESWTVPKFHVPRRSGFSIIRKSGVQSQTARLARKMETPNVTTTCASPGPVITLLTRNL